MNKASYLTSPVVFTVLGGAGLAGYLEVFTFEEGTTAIRPVTTTLVVNDTFFCVGRSDEQGMFKHWLLSHDS
jgi:hypothetical protein